MNKENYISWCKQEELTITMIAMYIEVIMFGFVLPAAIEELRWVSIIVVIISMVLSFVVFWNGNKGMRLCYKLIHERGIIRRAVVEKHKIKVSKMDFVMTVWFRVLDTDVVYEWKEHYADDARHNLASQMHQYLEKHPEIEVLLDPCDHKKHYILFEQVMLSGVRRTQGIFKVINIILGIILLILIIVMFVKACVGGF